jgi:hypothetical protein
MFRNTLVGAANEAGSVGFGARIYFRADVYKERDGYFFIAGAREKKKKNLHVDL